MTGAAAIDFMFRAQGIQSIREGDSDFVPFHYQVLSISVNIESDMYGQVLLLQNRSKDAGEVNLPKEVGNKMTFQELQV